MRDHIWCPVSRIKSHLQAMHSVAISVFKVKCVCVCVCIFCQCHSIIFKQLVIQNLCLLYRYNNVRGEKMETKLYFLDVEIRRVHLSHVGGFMTHPACKCFVTLRNL